MQKEGEIIDSTRVESDGLITKSIEKKRKPFIKSPLFIGGIIIFTIIVVAAIIMTFVILKKKRAQITSSSSIATSIKMSTGIQTSQAIVNNWPLDGKVCIITNKSGLTKGYNAMFIESSNRVVGVSNANQLTFTFFKDPISPHRYFMTQNNGSTLYLTMANTVYSGDPVGSVRLGTATSTISWYFKQKTNSNEFIFAENENLTKLVTMCTNQTNENTVYLTPSGNITDPNFAIWFLEYV